MTTPVPFSKPRVVAEKVLVESYGTNRGVADARTGCMTSLGANIDESINNGRGPYMFKISGQLYHWIGSLCLTDGKPPRFLQFYICDTDNKIDNRLSHYGGDNSILRRDIVEGLIELLDSHNASYNVVAAKEYELPTGDMLGAIVYETGPESNMGYDIVLEQRGLRYMYSHYLDALAICRVYGNPSYFITFTCNVKWPEISDLMAQFPLLTTTDRAYIVDRVFEMKIHEFVNYLRDAQPFGKVVAVLYTVEFQKRGLPHCHTLLWIDESVRILLAFYAHINVEYCGWTMLIKYLFKYISKGTDRIIARVSKSNSPSVNNDTAASTSRPHVVVDEIKNYLDARYISPHEACWRIFEFEIHYREPAVQLLAVHLQDMQQVVFREGDHHDSVVLNSHKKKSTLTEWLYYNQQNDDGRHLTYLNFLSEYVWYPNEKYWRRRQRRTKSSIGRLANVHPAAGDLFYQRMLLCHQKGCTSFPGIRTVNTIVYLTCCAACEALGLLQDDREWEITLEEAALTATVPAADPLASVLVGCVETPQAILAIGLAFVLLLTQSHHWGSRVYVGLPGWQVIRDRGGGKW
ncbi:DNA helicase [Tanacetum coccineum]|uniref:DNA helicase n=1 Tax=Tanacetum coccineum TaxID=301880 RepID=A0ABQ5HFJ7_9ASTR